MIKSQRKQYKNTHFCGMMWCSACDNHVSITDHQCYNPTISEKQKEKYLPTNKIIFYDYETYCHPDTKEHIAKPYCCVSMQ